MLTNTVMTLDHSLHNYFPTQTASMETLHDVLLATVTRRPAEEHAEVMTK